MAAAKTTATATADKAKRGPRTPVDLPDPAKITATDETLNVNGRKGAANPYDAVVQQAVATFDAKTGKGKVHRIDFPTKLTDAQANKVRLLLQRASQSTPCSVFSQWDNDKTIRFQAITKRTRKTADKAK